MIVKTGEKQHSNEFTADGKAKYLLTGGGKIVCLRCTAKSSRTKEQCERSEAERLHDLNFIP